MFLQVMGLCQVHMMCTVSERFFLSLSLGSLALAVQRINNGLTGRIVDPSLIIDEDLFEEVWAVAIIAKACLNSKPSKRPSMKHILKALENPHKVVREENFGEPFALRTSLHSSWNDALFGSWRQHTNAASGHYRSGDDSYPGMLPIARQAGSASSSGPNSSSREVYHLHHTRRGSSDIVPEPIEEVADESDDESRLQSQR
jgi:hypothetical protein